MIEQRLDKLRVQAEYLLDLFIALREKYSLLHPLAFDQNLIERWAEAPAVRGLQIMRNSLLQACVQDISKLALDSDKRVPSIRNILETLEADEVRSVLKDEYSEPRPVSDIGSAGPSVEKILTEMQEHDARERRERFDAEWDRLLARWSKLKESTVLGEFKVWRDKLIAHSDLHHRKGEYRLLDLSELGLKWDDLEGTIGELQSLVASVTLLVRGASFAWDSLDEQLHRASREFWEAKAWPTG